MKIFFHYPRFTMAALALGVITASIIFVVYAQSSNTIQGCYSNGNGSLRRVNSPSDCNNSETPISWNIAGPPGPQGPPGGTIGVTGKWEGNITGSDPNRCYPGSNALAFIFIELPTGDITGSTKVGNGSVSSSVFGKISGSDITLDSGGSGVLLTGTLEDANNMSGTVSDCCFPGPPCGTWSANPAKSLKSIRRKRYRSSDAFVILTNEEAGFRAFQLPHHSNAAKVEESDLVASSSYACLRG